MALSQIIAEYRRRTPGSEAALKRASEMIPGGLVQGSRYFAPYPIVVASADGPGFVDVDGNRYIDYFQAATAQFLGHRYPAIQAAVEHQMAIGWNYGLPYELERKVSEQLKALVPSAEMVTFTNTGMDACLLAVRSARATTGRAKIATFRGHFHGWEDQLFAQYGTGIGIPPEIQQHTVVMPYNDAGALRDAFRHEAFAAVLLEPYSTNCGAIPTDPAFLKEIRALASEHGAALVFDECVTGFRLAPGGAQEWFGVTPDMTVLGKALSGGFTVTGALVGSARWMEVNNRERGEYVYHGAWQNPVTMAATSAALEAIADGRLIAHANRLGDRVRDGLNRLFRDHPIAGQAFGLGSAIRVAMTDAPIRNPDDLARGDRTLLAAFQLGLVNRGHFAPPGRNLYTSAVQTDATVDDLLLAADAALDDALDAAAA